MVAVQREVQALHFSSGVGVAAHFAGVDGSGRQRLEGGVGVILLEGGGGGGHSCFSGDTDADTVDRVPWVRLHARTNQRFQLIGELLRLFSGQGALRE